MAQRKSRKHWEAVRVCHCQVSDQTATVIGATGGKGSKRTVEVV